MTRGVITIATNVNQGKNALGGWAGRDGIRSKIDGLQWSYLDAAAWGSILREFDEFVVTVKFPDMKTGGWKTERMYPGNRTAKVWEEDEDGASDYVQGLQG